MEIHPHTATVLGNITDTKWGQVLQTPHAYGVVEIHIAEGNARQKGVEVLSHLSRMLDTPPQTLTELEQFADTAVSDHVASLIVFVPLRGIVYIVSRGESRVYIRRNNQLARLVSGNQSLSGAVKAGDTLIAASSGFVHSLKDEDIMGVFDHGGPDEVAERLTLVLHEHAIGDGGAALIFHVLHVSNEEPQIASEKQTEAVVLKKRLLPRLRKPTLQFSSLIARMRNFKRLSAKQILTIVVISMFLVSVILGLVKQQGVKKNSTMTSVMAQAQHAFDEGVALSDLNPVKGRERLNQAKELLAPLVSDKPKTDESRALNALYEQVVEQITRALHITHSDLQVFFDVSLLKTGASITDASLFDDTFGLLDAKGKTVFSLKASAKNGAIIGGGNVFEGASQIAASAIRMYILSPNGIHAIRVSDQKVSAQVIKSAPEWGTVGDMTVFGDNVYLLDTTKSRVWKYVVTETGFTELREYLNPDYFPDLSASVNMVIDGSIWMGTNVGDVLRFTQGTENSYNPQGAEPALGKNVSVYVSDEVKMVYILDSDNHRVVVFDKDGLYISQYVWDSGQVATQLFVSETLAKIFLLSDGKLYFMDLK